MIGHAPQLRAQRSPNGAEPRRCWRARCAVLGAAAGVLLAVLPASAATYHARPSNCDDRGPGTAQLPWCSLENLADRLRPGDTLEIGSGRYDGSGRVIISGIAGTAAAPIVLRAADGAEAIIDGSNLSFRDQGLLLLTDCRHVILQGLVVRNSSSYGIALHNTQGVVLQSNRVQNTIDSGVQISDSTGTTVRGNAISHANEHPNGPAPSLQEALSLSNVTNFIVEQNHVFDCAKEGIDAKDGSADGEIRYNLVERVGAVGIYLNKASRIRVYRNVIRNAGQSGVMLGTGDGAAGFDDTADNDIYLNEIHRAGEAGFNLWRGSRSGTISRTRIYNNTVYQTDLGGVVLWPVAQQTTIVNNIFVQTSQGGVITMNGGSLADQQLISNNLYYQTDGKTVGHNAVLADPMLRDPSNGDLRLGASSPAIGQGLDIGLPAADVPDIGAHEVGLTAQPSPGPPSNPGTGPVQPVPISPTGTPTSGAMPNGANTSQTQPPMVVEGGCRLLGPRSTAGATTAWLLVAGFAVLSWIRRFYATTKVATRRRTVDH